MCSFSWGFGKAWNHVANFLSQHRKHRNRRKIAAFSNRKVQIASFATIFSAAISRRPQNKMAASFYSAISNGVFSAEWPCRSAMRILQPEFWREFFDVNFGRWISRGWIFEGAPFIGKHRTKNSTPEFGPCHKLHCRLSRYSGALRSGVSTPEVPSEAKALQIKLPEN